MTSTPEIQDQIRRYLLGELDDGTRAEVEKRFLSDCEVFEELLVAEDEIIDDTPAAGSIPKSALTLKLISWPLPSDNRSYALRELYTATQ